MNAKALPQKIIDAMRPEDRTSLGIKTSAEQLASISAKNEAQLQKSVEAYLIQLGYEKRTTSEIQRSKPRSGWQVHLHAAKKNPMLLDLLILGNDGRYLELELKTATGKLSDDQKKLVEHGGSVAYSAEEAAEIIRRWHTGKTTKAEN